MKFIKKAFAPKEVKDALSALEEAAHLLANPSFPMVRDMVEDTILSKPTELVQVIRESGGRTPTEWVYSQIANIAGDCIETGQYHIYRGVLNPTGKDLLQIYDAAYDKLLQMKALDPDYVSKQKAVLRQNIESMG